MDIVAARHATREDVPRSLEAGHDGPGRARLRLLSRGPLDRWVDLLVRRTAGEGPGAFRAEVVKAALLRGRLCERVGNLVRLGARDLPTGTTLFLLGLASHLEELLGIPAADVLRDADPAWELRDGALVRASKTRTLLAAVRAYAEAEWERAAEDFRILGIDPDVIPELYLDAVGWAAERLHSTCEEDASVA